MHKKNSPHPLTSRSELYRYCNKNKINRKREIQRNLLNSPSNLVNRQSYHEKRNKLQFDQQIYLLLQDALKSFDFLPDDQSSVIDLDNLEPKPSNARPVSYKDYRAPSPPTAQPRPASTAVMETPKSSRQQSYAVEPE